MLEIDLEKDALPGETQSQPLQVLVADDSPVYHKLVKDALFYQPYSLLFAKSGQEAMELFVQHSPSIVITDWMMPDLTGPEFCKRIREASLTDYTYVILLTSMTESDSVVKGLEAGADEFLSKPFDAAELQARLGVGRRIVQLHRQVEARDKQLEKTSRVDALTQLPNHAAIQEWATWQLRSAAAHKVPVWLAVIDVDSFGAINETFGTDAGDTVLREFARMMNDHFGPAEMCGRVGDDEFCCVLSHFSKDEVAASVEQLRAEFPAHEFRFANKIVTTTASFGIAGFEGTTAPDFRNMFEHAERQATAAKQAGGNQVRIVNLPVAL